MLRRSSGLLQSFSFRGRRGCLRVREAFSCVALYSLVTRIGQNVC